MNFVAEHLKINEPGYAYSMLWPTYIALSIQCLKYKHLNFSTIESHHVVLIQLQYYILDPSIRAYYTWHISMYVACT